MLGKISNVHEASKGTYGSPRVHAELAHQGVLCGRNRVARVMRLHGLRGAPRKQEHDARLGTLTPRGVHI